MKARTSARRRSLWPYWSLIPLGLGAWAPIYAGVRARVLSWTAWGALWSVVVLLGFVFNGIDGRAGHDDLAGACLIIGWVGAVVTSFLIRGPFDTRVASPLLTAEQEARGRLRDRETARQLAREDPALASEMGIGRPDETGYAAGLVDVNHAPATVLAGLPGIDPGLAQRIVAIRERVRGFSSLEDLGTVMDLDGDVVEGLRDHTVFLPWV